MKKIEYLVLATLTWLLTPFAWYLALGTNDWCLALPAMFCAAGGTLFIYLDCRDIWQSEKVQKFMSKIRGGAK